MRALLKEIEAIPTLTRFGRVARLEGLAVEVTGAQGAVSLGGQCRISIGKGKVIPCEVVGFRDGRALVMPLGPLDGITLGARADFEDRPVSIYPSTASTVPNVLTTDTGLMQALKDIAAFDAGGSGNFNAAASLSAAQNTFLTGAIAQITTVNVNLNAATAANGYISNRLTDAQTQQLSMDTLYKGFASNIQDTNMADAATQLSLNQTQLEAALQVTAGLHQLSLLNYLPIGGG